MTQYIVQVHVRTLIPFRSYVLVEISLVCISIFIPIPY